jgi:acetyl esterase/lipase
MSPWTDLALTGATMQTRSQVDPLLTPAALASTARMYAGDRDLRDPRISPLYGDLMHLPPVRIHVGDAEILLDDALRYAEKLEAAGGTCTVHAWDGMPHVFPASVGTFAAAALALDDLGAFVRGCLTA